MVIFLMTVTCGSEIYGQFLIRRLSLPLFLFFPETNSVQDHHGRAGDGSDKRVSGMFSSAVGSKLADNHLHDDGGLHGLFCTMHPLNQVVLNHTN